MSESEKPLDDLRKSKEEEYFRRQNKELAAKLKAQRDKAERQPLAEAIRAAGFSEATIRALPFFSLIEELGPRLMEGALDPLIAERKLEGEARVLLKAWIENGTAEKRYLAAKTLTERILQGVELPGLLSDRLVAVWNRVAEQAGQPLLSPAETLLLQELCQET